MGYETAHLIAKFDHDSGVLGIESMASVIPYKHVGRDLISRSIEHFGANNLKTVTAQFAYDNKRIFFDTLASGSTKAQAARNTPLGRALHDLGFDKLPVTVNVPKESSLTPNLLPEVIFKVRE